MGLRRRSCVGTWLAVLPLVASIATVAQADEAKDAPARSERPARSEPPERSEPPAEAPADDAPSDEEPRLRDARAAFQEGIARVRRAEWGEALEAFERSAALRPHAVTTSNIAACYRAMSRYTRARAAFREALARHAATGELPAHLVSDGERYLDEIERLLAHVDLEVSPHDARVLVDGAPLELEGDRLVAGTRPAGPGERLPKATVEVLLDPGAHVILVQRKGYDDAVINRTLAPGAGDRIRVALARQKALLEVTADQPEATVRLDGEVVGTAPISLRRAAGRYEVVVSAPGFEPYTTEVALASGEQLALRATLLEESPSVLEQWWFWTAAGVVVTGAVIGTYFATRPEPTRPALDGGGLGWTVPLE